MTAALMETPLQLGAASDCGLCSCDIAEVKDLVELEQQFLRVLADIRDRIVRDRDQLRMDQEQLAIERERIAAQREENEDLSQSMAEAKATWEAAAAEAAKAKASSEAAEAEARHEAQLHCAARKQTEKQRQRGEVAEAEARQEAQLHRAAREQIENQQNPGPPSIPAMLPYRAGLPPGLHPPGLHSEACEPPTEYAPWTASSVMDREALGTTEAWLSGVGRQSSSVEQSGTLRVGPGHVEPQAGQDLPSELPSWMAPPPPPPRRTPAPASGYRAEREVHGGGETSTVDERAPVQEELAEDWQDWCMEENEDWQGHAADEMAAASQSDEPAGVDVLGLLQEAKPRSGEAERPPAARSAMPSKSKKAKAKDAFPLPQKEAVPALRREGERGSSKGTSVAPRSPPTGGQDGTQVKVTKSYIQDVLSASWLGDKGETYEFVTKKDDVVLCIRRATDGEEKGFRVRLDPVQAFITWGQSYFMDCADIAIRPNTVSWYRRSDTAKSKAVFVWQRTKPC